MDIEKAGTTKKNLNSLVLLRGIAVLIVCFCHFATAFWGKSSYFEYGKYGVQVFFVISGFVIPFSLLRGNFSWNNYHRFVYKRFIRLYPPYLAAVVLTFLLLFFKSKLHHAPFPENTANMIKTLFYAYIPDDNPVFWTLIVEAQYYLFVGCFFLLFFKYRKMTSFILLPLFLVVSQTTLLQGITFLHFIVFFFIGNLGFLIYEKIGRTIINCWVLLALLIYTFIFYNTPEFVSAFATIFFILIVKKRLPKILNFSGEISYSIYLIHYPLGLMIINLLRRRISDNYIWLIFIITTVIIFVVSWIFYKVFEEHCEVLSKKIKYNDVIKKGRKKQLQQLPDH